MKTMHTKFNHLLAIFALVIMAIAPAISSVYAKDNQTSSDVICSTTGIKVIKLNDDNSSSNNISIGDHCHYCSLGVNKLFFDSSKSAEITHNSFSDYLNYPDSSSVYDDQFILGFNSQAPPLNSL